MKRSELEHAIRAACDVAHDTEIIIIGSQAVLGQFPDAPADVTHSVEVDVYPLRDPTASDVIDGALGEDSTFDSTHGFYLHGVGPETATLPEGWESRLVAVRNENTRGHTGWCLEVHDLAASKLVAGREKDLDFVAALLRHGMIDADTLGERVQTLPLTGKRLDVVRARVGRLARSPEC